MDPDFSMCFTCPCNWFGWRCCCTKYSSCFGGFPVHEWFAWCSVRVSLKIYSRLKRGDLSSRDWFTTSDNPELTCYPLPSTPGKRGRSPPSSLLSNKSFVSGICVDHLRLGPRICEVVPLVLSQSSLCLRYIAIVALASTTYLNL